MNKLMRYQVERPTPETLLMEKEGAEEETEATVLRVPATNMVFRRPIDMNCERFVRSRLRYMPEVCAMDECWKVIIGVANRIKRAEARQRQIRRG